MVKKVNIHLDSFYITIKQTAMQTWKLLKKDNLYVWSLPWKSRSLVIYTFVII